MLDVGQFLITFFTNISMMLLCMYLGSLIYKYAIYMFSSRTKEVLFVLLAIMCGWTTMKYGFRFTDGALFDLRFLVIIVAPMFVSSSLSILLIGLGVGLARLSFGINAASIVGCFNVIFMSLLCIVIVELAKRKQWSFNAKMIIVIFTVNTMNVVFIAVFGVLPKREYLLHLAPGSFLLSLILSCLFTLLLREFNLEATRKQQLQRYNKKLREQYRISENKTGELLQAKVELEKKNEQVMLASRYKSEFLANMSHELRTPLNSMLVLSQLLEENSDGNLSADEVRYAQIIHTSGKDLLKLISEVLDMSKIESGHMDIHRTEYDITELLLYLNDFFEPLALQKNIQLKVERCEGVPEAIHADGQRILQILTNMLANAIKFSQDGRIVLKVYHEPYLQGIVNGENITGEWLAFSVEDNGIGIPADKHISIFDAFQQVDGTTSRQFGGTGLGLSISKQFAELMDGFIGLESKVGEGSRFTLYLPWKEATQLASS